MTDHVRPLIPDDIEPASIAMAKAFMHDPLQCYVFSDEKERAEKSPAHFAAILRYGYLFGEVYTLINNEGAVVWLAPGNTDVTEEKAELGGLTNLPLILGKESTARFFTVMDFLEPYHKQDAPEPHWYTMVIGVSPQFFGLGYGRALMAPVMEKAKAEGTPIYLETAEPTNIDFYAKLGFRLIRELTEPARALRLWTLKKT